MRLQTTAGQTLVHRLVTRIDMLFVWGFSRSRAWASIRLLATHYLLVEFPHRDLTAGAVHHR